MTLSRLSRGRRELLLFGVAYLLYSLGRWVAVGDTVVRRKPVVLRREPFPATA